MGASVDALDPDLRQGLQELSQWLGQQKIILTVTSTVRSARDQDFLWRRYKRGDSPLPAAPPGHSAHEYGWAFDAIVSPDAYQADVGRAWENLWGGHWGGARDPVHFELPGASKLAWQLGESGAQPIQAGPTGRTESLAGKVFDVVLGTFVPVYGSIQLATSIAQLAPGLSQNVILDWISNPGKYPELEWLQEFVTLA